MSIPRVVVFAFAVTLLSCSNDPFVLRAHAASVCQRLPGQRFQVPAAVRQEYAQLPEPMQHALELERSFRFEVRPELPAEVEPMLETHFALTSLRLTTVNEADDLGFLEEGRVRLEAQPGAGLEPRSFQYTRTEAAPRTLSWNGESVELAAYLQSGTLAYSVSLVGSLPPADVVVDLEACAEVAVKLDAL